LQRNNRTLAKLHGGESLPPIVSLSAYARHRKLNVKTVRDAIDQGQITAERKDGKVFIDQESADKEWLENRASRGHLSPGDKKKPDKYAAARALKEQANAELVILTLAERKKSLIKIEEVERQGYEMARRIRNSILNIPAKISPSLAAVVDPHEMEVILYRELNQALEDLSKIKTNAPVDLSDNDQGVVDDQSANNSEVKG